MDTYRWVHTNNMHAIYNQPRGQHSKCIQQNENALYAKLSKVKFHHAEYKAIVRHGSLHKDGFEVLYELMTQCHPKLMLATTKVRQINRQPSMDALDSIYSYVENTNKL